MKNKLIRCLLSELASADVRTKVGPVEVTSQEDETCRETDVSNDVERDELQLIEELPRLVGAFFSPPRGLEEFSTDFVVVNQQLGGTKIHLNGTNNVVEDHSTEDTDNNSSDDDQADFCND